MIWKKYHLHFHTPVFLAAPSHVLVSHELAMACSLAKDFGGRKPHG
jgi:hypothetical protein